MPFPSRITLCSKTNVSFLSLQYTFYNTFFHRFSNRIDNGLLRWSSFAVLFDTRIDNGPTRVFTFSLGRKQSGEEYRASEWTEKRVAAIFRQIRGKREKERERAGWQTREREVFLIPEESRGDAVFSYSRNNAAPLLGISSILFFPLFSPPLFPSRFLVPVNSHFLTSAI